MQDVVNELGRRLDYDVENGLYQGRSNAIGFDGLWSESDGHTIVVEVKTTDAYRINLDTIGGYRDELIHSGKINTASSVLLVVGRQDTGDLEAQVRGSRHAWTVRIISADALGKLVALKENTEIASAEKIHELLIPFEYTRLDKIIDRRGGRKRLRAGIGCRNGCRRRWQQGIWQTAPDGHGRNRTGSIKDCNGSVE